MSDLRNLLDILEDLQAEPEVGDIFELEFGDTLIETTISDISENGITIHLDETAMRMLIDAKKQQLTEGMTKQVMMTDAEKMSLDQFKDKYGDEDWITEFWKTTNDVDDEEIDEAKYQGREVPLGKPMAGDVKKSKVYVRGPKGNVVKVNFGDKNMKIKK